MWTNDIKCKYMFSFPLKNLARKRLTENSITTVIFCSNERAVGEQIIWFPMLVMMLQVSTYALAVLNQSKIEQENKLTTTYFMPTVLIEPYFVSQTYPWV